MGELGLAHEHIPAGGPYGLVKRPEISRANPNGRVPVIEDDGMILWESNAILRYLAARYGDRDFGLTMSAPGRSPINGWIERHDLAAEHDRRVQELWRTPEKDRNAGDPRFRRAHGSRSSLIDAVLAKHRYLVAGEFTLADIPNGVHLYRYYTMGTSVPKLPHVEAWYARLKERPAYRHACDGVL